jgi:NAD dependent epimerase/dehydratase
VASSTDTPRSTSGRKTLVTGAGGFIASHLVELLVRQGRTVRAFVRYNSRDDRGWLDRIDPAVATEVDVFVGDLVNADAVASAVSGCEDVFHLGALIPIPYSYRHPREFVAANVVGTLNVLEALRRTDVDPLVHVSSSEVYGSAQTLPMSEDHRLHPQSPYAATKVSADQLVLSYVRSFGLRAVIARPFNTYGPRQSARAVIPTIVTQALTGDHVQLGSVHPTRDFLYVADTAAGIARCAEVDDAIGEVVNLGTGREISIAEVVERVLAAVARELPVVLAEERQRPPESEVDRLCAAADKARELLGWEATVPFEDGLQRTIDWIASSLDTYRPATYSL